MELEDAVTPIDVQEFCRFLNQVHYDRAEINFLCNGFRHGFALCYQGPRDCRDSSDNIPFTVGNKFILWNKLMEEVQVGRVARPFKQIPFKDTYIQSPIGLVPKAGNKTRLIFHLSYDFKNGNKSVNQCILEDMCSVHYNDLDKAVKDCLQILREFGIHTLFFSKSDLKSAFVFLEYVFLIIACWS